MQISFECKTLRNVSKEVSKMTKNNGEIEANVKTIVEREIDQSTEIAVFSQEQADLEIKAHMAPIS